MVTPDGVVKLIDFGISKPMEPQLVLSETTATEPSSRMMTPDYASPEQIQGKELTTATDIYSLGVLLYELLAGSRPYTLRNLSPAAAERVVCEQNPRKPSSTADLSKRMRREISGDLDSIVLTAMHVDPSQRYQSVHHLDEDLLRYLQGKPIAAKKSSLVYLLRKFVQRHKEAAVLTACALFVAPCRLPPRLFQAISYRGAPGETDPHACRFSSLGHDRQASTFLGFDRDAGSYFS